MTYDVNLPIVISEVADELGSNLWNNPGAHAEGDALIVKRILLNANSGFTLTVSDATNDVYEIMGDARDLTIVGDSLFYSQGGSAQGIGVTAASLQTLLNVPDLGSFSIPPDIANPASDTDITSREYVDTQDAGVLSDAQAYVDTQIANVDSIGDFTVPVDTQTPLVETDLASMGYVDDQVAALDSIGDFTVPDDTQDPLVETDIASMGYVDTQLATVASTNFVSLYGAFASFPAAPTGVRFDGATFTGIPTGWHAPPSVEGDNYAQEDWK